MTLKINIGIYAPLFSVSLSDTNNTFIIIAAKNARHVCKGRSDGALSEDA